MALKTKIFSKTSDEACLQLKPGFFMKSISNIQTISCQTGIGMRFLTADVFLTKELYYNILKHKYLKKTIKIFV